MDSPIRCLWLGLQMHMAPRLIKARDAYAMADLPANGIIAGCTQSNTFARILLHRIMEQRYHDPRHEGEARLVRQYVDDIRQSFAHSNRHTIVRVATQQGAALAGDCIAIGRRISPKSVVVAN